MLMKMRLMVIGLMVFSLLSCGGEFYRNEIRTGKLVVDSIHVKSADGLFSVVIGEDGIRVSNADGTVRLQMRCDSGGGGLRITDDNGGSAYLFVSETGAKCLLSDTEGEKTGLLFLNEFGGGLALRSKNSLAGFVDGPQQEGYILNLSTGANGSERTSGGGVNVCVKGGEPAIELRESGEDKIYIGVHPVTKKGMIGVEQ